MNDNNRLNVSSAIKDDPFYQDLSRRVDEYFRRTGHSRIAGPKMVLKTITLITIFLTLTVLIYSNQFFQIGLTLLFIGWVFTQFLMTIGIAHDAAHNCYSSNPKVNRAIMYLFDFLGINSDHWIENHIFSHHGMPNIPLMDSAIESFSLIRLHPKTSGNCLSRYQHFYMFLIYSFATIFQVYLLEFVSFAQNLVGFKREQSNMVSEITIMLASKLFVLFYTLLLPLWVLDADPAYIIMGWLIGHMCCGVAIGVIFMTTHLHEKTQFIELGSDGIIQDSYARHIFKTTSEFSVDSAFANWITGGLNLHVTHHLFPAVSQIHLPALSKIVRQTAQEYGVTYYSYTFKEAIISHLKLLKDLGQRPSYVESINESYA